MDLGKGLTVPEVCKQMGISQQTYYRWRTKYGGMDPLMAKQPREKENSHLKKVVTDQVLDIQIMKEVAHPNSQAPSSDVGRSIGCVVGWGLTRYHSVGPSGRWVSLSAGNGIVRRGLRRTDRCCRRCDESQMPGRISAASQSIRCWSSRAGPLVGVQSIVCGSRNGCRCPENSGKTTSAGPQWSRLRTLSSGWAQARVVV